MLLPQTSSLSTRVFFWTFAFILAVGIPFSAHAATQQLTCSPSRVRFGSVTSGESETQLVTLTNSGASSATISSISTTNSEFTISGATLPIVVGAGKSVDVSIVFSPTKTDWTSGDVTFTSNASNATLELAVSGTGVTTTPLVSSPANLSFGTVTVGSSKTMSVVVTNNRASQETITALTPYGSGFSVSGPSLPLVLTKGESATLHITFTPVQSGLEGGSVFISGPVTNIPLRGTGGSGAGTTGKLTIAPSGLSFGDVNLGQTSTQFSTLTATGGSVTVTSATSNNSHFAVTGTSLPLTLNAGQSAEVYVVFSPTASGTASGSLTIGSNATDSQTSESLSGIGVVPAYSVDLSWNSSPSAVAGYNVYRGTAPGTYTKINSALDAATNYTDSSVAPGSTYYYAATSVNSSGQESGYSSPLQVVIPAD